MTKRITEVHLTNMPSQQITQKKLGANLPKLTLKCIPLLLYILCSINILIKNNLINFFKEEK